MTSIKLLLLVVVTSILSLTFINAIPVDHLVERQIPTAPATGGAREPLGPPGGIDESPIESIADSTEDEPLPLSKVSKADNLGLANAASRALSKADGKGFRMPHKTLPAKLLDRIISMPAPR
ncbi:hypothetical protein Clacol_010537 [Clathrus columnatus]|uniref:Uncharacterized protein n=1 Tax=Clathrus columnatus TaxID=1419009 RepID=A0AAV5ATX7_9AGAM|nr:hypothetical protein Clacol_010537 [Clathrus columnatus]